jgi:hypothetical protein
MTTLTMRTLCGQTLAGTFFKFDFQEQSLEMYRMDAPETFLKLRAQGKSFYDGKVAAEGWGAKLTWNEIQERVDALCAEAGVDSLGELAESLRSEQVVRNAYQQATGKSLTMERRRLAKRRR